MAAAAFRHQAFLGLLNEGILLAPNLVGAVSTAIGDGAVDDLVQAFRRVLRRIG